MNITPALFKVGPALGLPAVGLAGTTAALQHDADVVYKLLLDPGGFNEGDFAKALHADGGGNVWPADDPVTDPFSGRTVQFTTMAAPPDMSVSGNTIIRAARQVNSGDCSIATWDVFGSGQSYYLGLPGSSFFLGPVVGPDGLLYFIERTGIAMQAWVTKGNLRKPSDDTIGADPVGLPLNANFRRILVTSDNLVAGEGHLITFKSTNDKAYVWEIPGGAFSERTLVLDDLISTQRSVYPGFYVPEAANESIYYAVDTTFGNAKRAKVFIASPTQVDSVTIDPALQGATLNAQHAAEIGKVFYFGGIGGDDGYTAPYGATVLTEEKWNVPDSDPVVETMRFVFPFYTVPI